MSEKILIVEDNPEVLSVLKKTAVEMGLEHDVALDGQSGLDLALGRDYDLLLVDVNLPILDGFRLCECLRRELRTVPIIIITSRGAERDKIKGLNIGADDYIVKPFSTNELGARVNALLRRCRNSHLPSNGTAKFGAFTIDVRNQIATVNGEPLNLTLLELEILAFFASRPNQIVSRKDLMKNLWGEIDTEFGRAITTYICRLRAKIEPDPKHPTYLQTVHGTGYRFTG